MVKIEKKNVEKDENFPQIKFSFNFYFSAFLSF